MVLESVVTALHAERKPQEMLLYGFITAVVASLLAIWVFPAYSSFAMVTFTVMAALPLIINIIKEEKNKSSNAYDLLSHKQAMLFFVFLFTGYILGFLALFIILPSESANTLFSLQMNTIAAINVPTGSSILTGTFSMILMNNLRILGFSVLFSFIFGSGAIFILTWNASVVSAAIGSTMKVVASASNGGYLTALGYGMARYMIHGIPEMAAYFLGGLAGGIISFAVLDYKLGARKFDKSIADSMRTSGLLVGAAIAVLIGAAFLEVLITATF